MTVSPPNDLPPPMGVAVPETSGTAPDLDLATALAMMNHQPRYLARMVRAALATLPRSLAAARQSLDTAQQTEAAVDWAQVEGVAHQLKGALAVLMAKAAAASAGELESAARHGEAAAAATALADLENKTRALLPALEDALQPGGLAWTGEAPP